jgi:hypothetical protein
VAGLDRRAGRAHARACRLRRECRSCPTKGNKPDSPTDRSLAPSSAEPSHIAAVQSNQASPSRSGTRILGCRYRGGASRRMIERSSPRRAKPRRLQIFFARSPAKCKKASDLRGPCLGAVSFQKHNSQFTPSSCLDLRPASRPALMPADTPQPRSA